MNAAQKAWLKRRKTTHDLLKIYQLRQEKADKRLDNAAAKLGRASSYFTRARDEKKYIERRIGELEDAIGQGKLYQDPKEKKKKPGRRIEL